MSKSPKLIHAERNKSLAEDLKNEKKYYDWVITISFYSSIHFLKNLLLPITIGALKCKNIQQVKNAYNLKGRHIARLKLIQMNTPMEIAVGYKWLTIDLDFLDIQLIKLHQQKQIKQFNIYQK